jgi:hypothetical protein
MVLATGNQRLIPILVRKIERNTAMFKETGLTPFQAADLYIRLTSYPVRIIEPDIDDEILELVDIMFEDEP